MPNEAIPSTRSCERIVVLYLERQAYGLPVSAVEEILPLSRLARPAGAPSILAGILDVGGEPVAVLDMRRLFGLPDGEFTPETLILRLKGSEPPIGVAVDRVSEIASVRDDEIVPLGEGCAVNDCVTGVVRRDAENVLLLNAERLVLAQERRRLADLDALKHRREETVGVPA
jgi:purine-binding chemotaxis protein CheW